MVMVSHIYNSKFDEKYLDAVVKVYNKTGTLWEFEGAVASCCHAFAAVCTCWLVAEQKENKYK